MPRAAARHVIAPRLVRLPDAARYVSMGETKFCELVKAGVFPPGVPVGAMRLWDVRRLDQCIDRLFDEVADDPYAEVVA